MENVRRVFVFFWSAVVFTFELSHGYHFCPVSFISLNHSSEACSALDDVQASFLYSCMSCRCTLGVILVGWPLLGMFTTLPCFLHLWIMAVTVVHWSPKVLRPPHTAQASNCLIRPFSDHSVASCLTRLAEK